MSREGSSVLRGCSLHHDPAALTHPARRGHSKWLVIDSLCSFISLTNIYRELCARHSLWGYCCDHKNWGSCSSGMSTLVRTQIEERWVSSNVWRN